MRKPLIVFLFLIGSLFISPYLVGAFDHTAFDAILKTYVDEAGLVDYNGIAKDPRFSQYVKSLESARIEGLSREARLAFWINAYNALTIDKVIRDKPKKSVRETFIPGVWTSTKFFTSREHLVAGKRMSLDEIEHGILRKRFKDPRVHFALVCASRGCPRIPRAAYSEANVQDMLDAVTRAYLNSTRGLRIDRAENTLYLSKIFDWFGDDFIEKSGSILDFIRPYLGEEALKFLNGKPTVAFIDYNWALNAREPIR